MSSKKIIFLIIVGIIFIAIMSVAIYISGDRKPAPNTKWSITIWITDGTTESYKTLIDWFKKYAKEYAKSDIIVEKQTSNPDLYREILKSTLSEWNGPDIFMLHSGEDAFLETKIEPIPRDVLDFSEFDKKYDDIFQDLIASEWTWKSKKTALKWVPLAYETLGVFYNKALMRSVPKTWNELENLYKETNPDTGYPSNIGLGPTFTPNMTDILPLWLYEWDATTYTGIENAISSIDSYLKYASLTLWSPNIDWENTRDTVTTSLNDKKSEMSKNKLNTLDLFMRGDIAMIIGYPSLVSDLEKSSKRIGADSKSSVILTDRIPQSWNKNPINIGRYTYFGISKLTKNAPLSVKFMEYLMTSEAQRLYSNEYPYLIPAQSEFYASIESNILSDTLDRTKLSAFVPWNKEKVIIFQYWLKSRFERYLKEGIDTMEIPDTKSITKKIMKEISCDVNAMVNWVIAEDCQSE